MCQQVFSPLLPPPAPGRPTAHGNTRELLHFTAHTVLRTELSPHGSKEHKLTQQFHYTEQNELLSSAGGSKGNSLYRQGYFSSKVRQDWSLIPVSEHNTKHHQGPLKGIMEQRAAVKWKQMQGPSGAREYQKTKRNKVNNQTTYTNLSSSVKIERALRRKLQESDRLILHLIFP